jgi:hypothetical protein
MRPTTALALATCIGLVALPSSAGGGTDSASRLDLEAGVDPADLDDAGATGAPPPARIAALKADHLARVAAASTPAAAAARTTVVDCDQGKTVQRAVDRADDGDTVEVRGICHENVRIERKRLTLRGLDPALDGIQGVAATPGVPALAIYYTDGVSIENLSFSDGPDRGVGMWFSHVTMTGCRIDGNGGTGLWVSSSSFLDALDLTLSNNAVRGLLAQRSAAAFCTGCVVADNNLNAAVATTGGILSLLDSAVSGRHGIVASVPDSYADIDCVTSPTTAVPCGMSVTGRAALAFGGATAALFGAGDFTGQVVADDRGHAYVFGARQTAPGTTPGGSPLPNLVSNLATLTAEPSIDELGAAHQSQLKGHTAVEALSRALLLGETVVDGTLACDRAGDAWADPGVVVTAGGAITGCEHASAP